MYEPTLVVLARAIAEWFPELGGRCIAVSEVDPFNDKTNVPTLPIAVVALVSEQGTQGTNGGGSITVTDDILVHFIFEPTKYKLEGGEDSPFFAFYDYETIRDRLLANLQSWRTPRGGGVAYKSLDVESDEFAVYLAFRLVTSEKWCASPTVAADAYALPYDVQILSKLLVPCGCCEAEIACAECGLPHPEDDPCHAARKRNPYYKEES